MVKFDITSSMIHLLNLNGVFAGFPTNDTNIHILNFVRICTLYNLLGVSQNALRFRSFLFSLIGEVTFLLVELPQGSITNWNKFQK